MPIDNLPVRYRELGRLKFGEDLGDRPAQLTTWRLTSPNRELIREAFNLWGGTPSQTGDTFEVVTETGELDVLLPAQDLAAGQWFELWGAGGLQRRCSGSALVEYDQDAPDGWRKVAPCLCDEENGPRLCKPTTVLRVLLPQLPDLGVWKLVTRSLYAAAELPPAVDFLLQRAVPAPAVLGLDSRHQKSPGGPRKDYVVPVLRTRSTLLELASPATVAEGLQALPFEDRDRTPGDDRLLTPPAVETPPATGSGPDIRPQLPHDGTQEPDMGRSLDSGAQHPETANLSDPQRSTPREVFQAWLENLDPAELPHTTRELVDVLEDLEARAIAGHVWEPGALDRAAEKYLDGRDWRGGDLITATLRAFAQRAILSVLGKEHA